MSKIVIVGGYFQELYTTVEVPPSLHQTAYGGRAGFLPAGWGHHLAMQSAMLGADVIFVATVGEDAQAAIAHKIWQEAGINTDHIVRVPQEITGTINTIMGEEGQRLQAISAGANARMNNDQINATVAHIAEADLLVVTLEVPVNIGAYALKRAKLHQTPTLLLPLPPLEANLRAPLHLVDVVAMNAQRASQLGADLTGKQRVTVFEDRIQWWDQSQTHIAPLNIRHRVEETIYAALAVAIAEGQPALDAVQFAAAAAHLASERSLITRAILQKIIQAR